MGILLIIALLCRIMSGSHYGSRIELPTLSELKQLKYELINAYDTITFGEPPDPLAATVLHLIFRDCGGPPEITNDPKIISICDGCIDLDSQQHLQMNAVDPLDDIYLGPNGWSTKMSRSDFWAFAATIAILHAHDQLDNADKMPDIPYFFGRKDCSTSPDIHTAITKVKEFPSEIIGYSELKKWMKHNFGFNDIEIVAIMGAHSIVMNDRSDGVFTDKMRKKQKKPFGSFDNFYYKRIVQGNWRQKRASDKLQRWADGPSSIMLNVDISMFKNLDDHTVDGSVSCGSDINTCSASSVATIVQSFADNNKLWLDIFVPTYIKMITMGYDRNTDLIEITDGQIESDHAKIPNIPNLYDGTSSNTYLVYIIQILMVSNFICMIIYCCQKQQRPRRHKYGPKYKMVSIESTDCDDESLSDNK